MKRALISAASLLSASLLLSGSVSAAERCVDYSEFAREGGHLKHLKGIDGSNIDRALENFSCDHPACYGAVDIKGLIGRDGDVEDLSSTDSSLDARPAQFAKTIEARLLISKYAPPKLHGKPVCLKMHWNIVFGPSNAPGKS